MIKNLRDALIKNLLYIFLIIVLSFVLPRLIPGSPLFFSQEDMHVLNSNLPQENFNAFHDYYQPEKSLLVQLLIYIKNIARLDLGYSFYFKLPVFDLIQGRILWTLVLTVTSIIISSLIGIFLGVNLSLVRKTKIRRFLQGVMSFLQGFPVIVTAVVLQALLCYKLNLFPSSGAYTAGSNLGGLALMKDIILHSATPLLVLILSEIPPILILSYNICLKTKNENYVEMAEYLNLDLKSIKYKYIIKNGMPEILSKINIQFLYAISGSLFVEAVFSYPGMGSILKTAAFSRDFVLLQGILLVMGFYSVIINVLFYLIIKKVDPRC